MDDERYWSDEDCDEFKKLCMPMVEFLRKNYGSHAWAIIQYDRADLVEDVMAGVEFDVPD